MTFRETLRSWTSTDRATIVQLSTVAGVPVVRLHGSLGITAASPARTSMAAALARRPAAIVVDLADCLHDGRTARILLLVMRRHARRHGAQLRLAGASPLLAGEFARAGLSGLFGWSATVAEAITPEPVVSK